MLDIRSLSKKFGSGDSAFQALKSIDITIEEGEFFTLLGPSGCGKTTLLRLIAGFEQPSGGRLVLDGKDIATTPPNHRPVNTVFQSYALFPHMTVAQNVAFGLEARGTNPAEIAPRVDEILEIVQMAHLRDRKSSQMSGGQQQRVALARALAPRPRILLLDEPLSALDLKLRKQMQFELKRLQRELGLTFIFVTHDQDEALTMSDRIAVMDGGTLQQVADPRTLYDHPANRFVAEFIGEANFLSGTVAGGKLSLSGQAPVPLPGGADASGPVTVMIRPEQVVVGSAAWQCHHARRADRGAGLFRHRYPRDAALGKRRHPKPARPQQLSRHHDLRRGRAAPGRAACRCTAPVARGHCQCRVTPPLPPAKAPWRAPRPGDAGRWHCPRSR